VTEQGRYSANMSRPTEALIDICAMRHNLARARQCAPAAKAWAVVKADAYGHGLAAAMQGFEAADGLALIEFEQATRLRALGWDKPILMLEGAFDSEDVQTACDLNLSLVVHQPLQIDWLERRNGSRQIAVFLKYNSGMNRLGFETQEFKMAYTRLLKADVVRSISLATHFANSDLPGGADDALMRFDEASRGLAGERCLSNSAAVLAVPRAHRDAVRPGIMLYGATPFADCSAAQLELQPAMQLRSRLIAVRRLSIGDSVGYGSTFVADKPMRIGVVACGYADGYPRHAPTGTPIAVEGLRTRTLGRVAMDMLMVDLDPVGTVDVGASVELWGQRVPIDEVAQSAGTIGYELMCALAPRVPRRVIG
jgi:alanine racemase